MTAVEQAQAAFEDAASRGFPLNNRAVLEAALVEARAAAETVTKAPSEPAPVTSEDPPPAVEQVQRRPKGKKGE